MEKIIDLLKIYRGIEYELTIEVREENYFKYKITITNIEDLPTSFKELKFNQLRDWFTQGEKLIVFNLKEG